MRANVQALSSREFDVVIVGAGIHGAAAAWTAARIGLRAALIDAGDFGGATSAASLKVIHGGLRYLQHADFGRMRESIRARRRFLRLAPHLVRPQAFLMPTRGHGVRGRAAFHVALAANDLVSFDRNRGVDIQRRLPGGRLLSGDEARRVLAGIASDEITGGAVWYDAVAENTERLTFGFVRRAAEAGAIAANYVAAQAVRAAGGAVAGVTARDAESGETIEIRARAVLNAAGPWMEAGWTGRERAPDFPLVGAWNIIVARQWFGPYGVALEGVHEHRDADAVVQRGKRNLFFVPWRGGTMIGTVYEPLAGEPGDYRPSPQAIDAFLAEINAVYPPAKLKRADIAFIHAGVQPGPPGRPGASVEPDKHSEVLDASHRGGPRGMFEIKGVKYTTGLTVGERAALDVAAFLGRHVEPPRDQPLPGGDRLVGPDELRSAAAELRLNVPGAALGRMAAQYGSEAHDILRLATEDAGSVLPGSGGALAAEIRHAVRQEYAVRLTDALLRRTDLGTFSRPPDPVTHSAGAIMGKELGWGGDRLGAEIASVGAFFDRLGIAAPPAR